MSKPSWDDAPEWANWLAMDSSGEWWFHEFDPIMNDFEWTNSGRYKLADTGHYWKCTASKRL